MKNLMLFCLLLAFMAPCVAQTGHPVTAADAVEKAKDLQFKLKLTDKQTDKVAVIYQESAKKFDKIKAAEPEKSKLLVSIQPLRKETIKKIESVLTTSQTIKFEKLVKEDKAATGNSMWSQGWTSASIN